MKKLSFTEKNNFVLRRKDAKYFSLDLDLFRRTFLTHKLNTELSRANLHTYDRLDGQMLYALLDALPPDDILANRNGTLPTTGEAKTSAPEAENPAPNPKNGPLPTPNEAKTSAPEAENPAPNPKNGPLPTPNEAKTSAPEAENPAIVEELKTLNQRVDDLETGNELNSDEIDGLRSALDDSETSIEDLQSAIEELEKKAFNKKKASGKSSQP